jgi:hypothetical protein
MTSTIAQRQQAWNVLLLDFDLLTALLGDSEKGEDDPWLRASEIVAGVVEERTGQPQNPRELWIGAALVAGRRLSRLVARGWVERDPRRRMYRITPEGVKVGCRAFVYSTFHGETYDAAEAFVQRADAFLAGQGGLR